MTRSSMRLAASCGAVLLLACAAAPASAAYLGYGNGDPGGWDFWTEQNGGPRGPKPTPNHVQAKPVHHAHHYHRANETKPS